MRTFLLINSFRVQWSHGVGRASTTLVGLILALFWLATPSGLVAMQPAPSIVESDAQYSFGQAMTFSLKVESAAPIRTVILSVQAPELSSVFTAHIDAGLRSNVDIVRVVDLTRLRLAPFTTVTYWWSLETETGVLIETEPQSLAYVDDQFEWRRREQEGIQIHWSEETDAVGIAVERAVLNALAEIEALIPIDRPDPLQVYIYPSAADLRAALRLSGRDWVGAHAHPELGVILVAEDGPATGSMELARSVAHELAHLYVYESTGDGHDSLPLWLDEGIATLVEGATGNAGYASRLEEALATGQTIAFADLCYTLPTDADQVLLAYAQSEAFVSYLLSEYGEQTLQRLINEVAQGADCQSAPLRALGKSLAELNEEWLEQAVPRNPVQQAWQNGRIWLILIAGGFLLAALLARMPASKKGSEDPYSNPPSHGGAK